MHTHIHTHAHAYTHTDTDTHTHAHTECSLAKVDFGLSRGIAMGTCAGLSGLEQGTSCSVECDSADDWQAESGVGTYTCGAGLKLTAATLTCVRCV